MKRVLIPEKEVVKFVETYFANSDNVCVWRRNVGKAVYESRGKRRFVAFSRPGQSDIEGIIKRMYCPRCGRIVSSGVHLEIECKRADGVLPSDQKKYLSTIRKMGGQAIVARPQPSEGDPIGFNAIRDALENIDTSLCVQCARR